MTMEDRIKSQIFDYLNGLPVSVIDLLEELDKCHIYGGTIRRLAFTGGKPDMSEIDLDIVCYGDTGVDAVLKRGGSYILNKKGYNLRLKTKIEGKDLDVWQIEETYHFANGLLTYDYAIPSYENLFKTSRFNIDQIVFDYGTGELYYSEGFANVYRNCQLNLVNPNNMSPNKMLLKALQIARDHELSIGRELMDWMISTMRDTVYISDLISTFPEPV